MWTDRRRFLGLVGSGLAGLLWRASASGERQPDWTLAIHRGTRNTPWRALRGGRGALRAPDRFKPYPGAPRHRLPAWEADPGPSLGEVVRGYAPAGAFAPEPLSLPVLARLLSLSNGVTGRRSEHPLRAAPSAGALYAGEVYVVAERVEGLPAGLYYYAVEDHALVELRRGTFGTEVRAAVEAGLENAAVTVLLSNVFDRYAVRYGPRGYRYCVVDSGHIGENLRLAAAGLGLSDHSPLRFDDDRLHALLGIDGRKEAVCALHAIGKPRPVGPESAPRVRWLAPLVPEPPGDPEDPRIYHRASKLMGATPGDSPPPGKGPLSPPSPTDPSQGATAGALPRRRGAPAVPLADAIEKRRSAERFVDEPLAPADLAFALEMAAAHPSLERAPDVELLVVAHRVASLAPGLYRYQSQRSALAPLRQQDLRARLRRACMGQAKAASAAAAILMVGDLVAASRRAGARGYRDLLLEAGAMGQRIYLAAESLGIAARNLAAFWDDSLNDLVGIDGRRRAVIHLTLLGPGD
ncbi:MAG: SagB family peptide dehydrogenase [Myxococcota bacterium]